MEDVCKEKHKRINEILDSHSEFIDDFEVRLGLAEKDIISQKKDTTHLQEAIKTLTKSIETLISKLAAIELKPLAKYEAIAMVVVSTIIGILIGGALK